MTDGDRALLKASSQNYSEILKKLKWLKERLCRRKKWRNQ